MSGAQEPGREKGEDDLLAGCVMRGRKTRKGAILVIILGILMLLTLLATAFSTVSMTERSIARNYTDLVRAKLCSQSGIDHALALLPQVIASDPFLEGAVPLSRSWIYYGNELDESKPPQPAVPLEVARNPSFAYEDEPIQNPADPNTRPIQILVHGKPVGFSGITGGTYGRNGDVYTLKIQDLSGRLYVNDGLDQFGGNNSSVSQNLRRILNRLGEVVKSPGLGDLVLARRPPGGYRSRFDLEHALGSDLFKKVGRFLTTYAWVDRNVCNPVPLSSWQLSDYPVPYYRGHPPLYRYGRGKDAWNKQVPGQLVAFPSSMTGTWNNAIYALDELNPQWIEIVGRAPVNVNQAPREVLIALLADLQGIFISYRRRNNVEPANVGMYWFPLIVHTFSPEGNPPPLNVPSEGDEYGFLYKTAPIRYLEGGTTLETDAVSAAAIADAMMSARPFKTWRQFNAFCDNLVKTGIIEDRRKIFYDYSSNVAVPGNITGWGPLVPSDYQRAMASQAIADVLKANFNPNLHLNELNPDANLHLLVDKTDLIVNSTEFIFTPTGYFEIESVGRVLLPRDPLGGSTVLGGRDALTAPDNQIIAEHKVVVGVKLFDLIRETHQKHFADGKIAPRRTAVPTNNDGSLEIGPEVDSGPAPLENEWDGYLALPTVGGLGGKKPPGTFGQTPAGVSEYGETMHCHFQWDYDMHYHKDGIRECLSHVVKAGEMVENHPDPSENYGGPYDPVHGIPGRHRLARSFRLPAPVGGSETTTVPALPVLFKYAPEDLRIDGAYVERHSSPAWWISKESFVPNARHMDVVATFWLKPSYPPDRSGKPRLLLNANRWTGSWLRRAGLDLCQEAYFALYYNAAHEATPGGVQPAESMGIYGELNWWASNSLLFGYVPFRPQAFVFGRGYGPTLTPGLSRYYASCHTTSVNHEGHPDNLKTLYRAHQWTHLILVAKPRPDDYVWGGDWASSIAPKNHRILVNGKLLPGTLESYLNHNPEDQSDASFDWTTHANGERNSIRFGAPSRFTSGWFPPHDNFSADATIDEFYLWNTSAADGKAMLHWLRGRYYKPLVQASSVEDSEGVYRSGEVQVPVPRRVLPPPSHVRAPATSAETVTSVAAESPGDIEIIGMTWTLYGEDASSPNVFVTNAANGQPLAAHVKMYLRTADKLYGPFTDDAYSPMSIRLRANETFKYLAQFVIQGLNVNTILTTTPVVDDVTIYFRCRGASPLMYWVNVRTTAEDRP